MSISFEQLLKGTISTKTRKSSIICNYLIDKIDNNDSNMNNDLYEYSQTIKRLLRYNTKNPLALKSTNLKGETVVQPDLNLSLQEENIEGKQCLFNGSFDPDMAIDSQCYIFISNPKDDFTKYEEGWSTSYFNIHIVLPSIYDFIQDDIETGLSIKKGDAICNMLCDLFDGNPIVDKKYADYIGNVELKIFSRTYNRLSKTGNGVVYTLSIKVKTIDSRKKIYG